MVKLRLIGTPALVAAGGSSVPLERKDAAMLAVLALDGATARDTLAAMLWPDVALKTANVSLRQRVFRLRKRSGHELVRTGEAIALADGVAADLTAAGAPAETLLSGELLGGFSYADCATLADWVRLQRERWRARRRDALTAAASGHEARGELARAIELTQHVVAEEPLSEHVQRRLMRLHYLRGDRAAALQAFESFERMLKDELGVRPDRETLELLQTIENVQPVAIMRRPVVPASLKRPPRMIGRQAELAALDQAWAGERVFVLHGEAGLGKTRLLQEFASGQDRAVWLSVRPGDAAVPFALLARLLRAVHGAAGEAALPADSATRSELARVLPELGIGLAIAGEGQRLLLQRAIETSLAQAMARGASSFLIDDLHFADAASLEMLQGLVASERLNTLRWGFAQRPGEASEAAEVLARALAETQGLLRVTLAPLDVVQMQALIESLNLPEVDAQKWAAALVRHTGGNPLFALETLKDMVLAGVPAQIGSALPQPATVGALIERRLRQLSPAAMALARVAAVAGADFTIDLAERVLKTPALALADAWSELEAAQVLQGAAFAHDLVYEAALRTVPSEIARHTHAAVAEYLEALKSDPARVAEHWRAAGRPLPYGRSLVAAAMRAQSTGRVREAFDFLSAAATAFAEGGDQAAAFEAMTEAQPAALTALSPDTLRAWTSKVVASARGPAQRARALCVQATVANQLGDTAAAIFAANEATVLAEESGDSVTALRAARACAIARLAAGEAQAALAVIEPHISAAELIADRSARAELLADYALLLERTDRRDEAVALYDRAAQLASEGGNLIAAQVAIANAAVSCVYLGRLREALARNERAIRLASEMESDSISIAVDRINRGGMLIQAGQLGEALELLGTALPVVEQAQVTSWWLMATQHLAFLWAVLGQPGRAKQLAERLPRPAAAAMLAQWHGLQLRVRRWMHEPADIHLDFLQRSLSLAPLLTRQRLPIEIEVSRAARPAESALRLRRLAQEARERRQFAFAATADGLCVASLLAAGENRMAAELAARWLDEHRRTEPYDVYLPELLLVAATAIQTAGDSDGAGRVIGDARQWIERAGASLPAALQGAYRKRNHINAQIAAWNGKAARIG